jgi:hypothetical protein
MAAIKRIKASEVDYSWFTSVQNPAAVKEAINRAVELVNEGEINPLKVYMAIHDIEKACEAIKTAIKKAAVNEAEKHGKGEHTIFGHTFSCREAGVRYDYSVCDEWKYLDENRKELEAQLKAGYVDTETGEVLKAEKKGGSTAIIITQK